MLSPLSLVALLAVLATGLALEDLLIEVISPPAAGCRQAVDGDMLKVMYEGSLADGTKFDSSYDRGTPLPVPLGKGHVVKGFEDGLRGLCVGEVRKLTIPPHLGYGDRGAGGAIPGGATIVFKGPCSAGHRLLPCLSVLSRSWSDSFFFMSLQWKSQRLSTQKTKMKNYEAHREMGRVAQPI